MKTRNQIWEPGREQRFFTRGFHHNHLVSFMNLSLLKIYGVSILELWSQAQLLKNSSLLIWMPNDPGDPLIYSSGFKISFILPSIFNNNNKKFNKHPQYTSVLFICKLYRHVFLYKSGPRVSCCPSAPRFPLNLPFPPWGSREVVGTTKRAMYHHISVLIARHRGTEWKTEKWRRE